MGGKQVCKMKRLVIALPYYSADRAAAFTLARFITDLEPKFRDDVELCFVSRFDSMPITPGEMMRFVTTFRVSWHHCEPGPVGHPHGANAMAREFFVEAIKRINGGEWAEVDAILFMEPDCVPVARDWIDQLIKEWQQERWNDALVIGCYRDKNVDTPHINGNALWFPRLADHADLTERAGLGWDSAVFSSLGTRW